MPNRFDLKTSRKRRGAGSSKPSRNRPRGESDSLLPYWIAAAVVAGIVILVVAVKEWPHVHGWMTAYLSAPGVAGNGTSAPTVSPQDDEMVRHLQEKLAADKKRDELAREKMLAAAQASARGQATATVPAQSSKNPPPAPTMMTEAQAAAAARAQGNPALTGIPIARPTGGPARALPLDPNVLTTERIAAYQVALERMHFSCGFIDGDQGMRTQRMLRAFQESRGLPRTGVLDAATRDAIGEPGEPFLNYTVTPEDVTSIMPKPQTWRDKAKATRLGYNDIWELLAEKFHCTRGYLKELNRDVPQPVAGSDIIGPKVYPAAPYPQAAALRVNLGETSIEALDASGRIIAFFPCSIAKDKNKRPNGRLVVKSVVPDPDYTFDPALFKDAAVEEHITHKMTLPPGPRNPVGTAWIGLSLPGYGIHGTPEPENISRTQSHGCFRLANWNANKVLRMVRVGTPVDVEP
jgi:lipoprotein-anchoring transpeptidase ErfK/SrfK